jgi:hypothetical protein
MASARRATLAAALLAAAAAAAPTHVMGRLATANHTPVNGYILISWATFSSGGTIFPGKTLRMPVTEGNFDARLEPTTYTLTWGSIANPESWTLTVPTSAATVALADCIAPLPDSQAQLTPTTPIPLSQLAPGGALLGQMILWNGSQYAPADRSYATAINAATYDDGFIQTTNGAATITGTGTAWTSDLSGRWLFTLPCTEVYRVTITDAAAANLDRPYNCPTAHRRYNLTASSVILQSQHHLGIAPARVTCTTAYYDDNGTNVASAMHPAQVRTNASGDVELLWRTETHGTCALSP